MALTEIFIVYKNAPVHLFPDSSYAPGAHLMTPENAGFKRGPWSGSQDRDLGRTLPGFNTDHNHTHDGGGLAIFKQCPLIIANPFPERSASQVRPGLRNMRQGRNPRAETLNEPPMSAIGSARASADKGKNPVSLADVPCASFPNTRLAPDWQASLIIPSQTRVWRRFPDLTCRHSRLPLVIQSAAGSPFR